jgi:transcriptional regulator with XRE-family HTH domain
MRNRRAPKRQALYAICVGRQNSDRSAGSATPSPSGAIPNEEPDELAVGRVLRLARARRGWSIREVSRRTGRPNTYLSQIERGVIRRPDPTALWDLATLYDLDFELLAEWSGHAGNQGDFKKTHIAAALQAFSNLDDGQRTKALDYLNNLAAKDRNSTD